jgi:hypothetical protein
MESLFHDDTAVCNTITDSCLDLFPYEVTLCFNFTFMNSSYIFHI